MNGEAARISYLDEKSACYCWRTVHSVARIRAVMQLHFSLQRNSAQMHGIQRCECGKEDATMKFNEHGGFDGLDEKIRIYAAADMVTRPGTNMKATAPSTMTRKKRRSWWR